MDNFRVTQRQRVYNFGAQHVPYLASHFSVCLWSALFPQSGTLLILSPISVLLGLSGSHHVLSSWGKPDTRSFTCLNNRPLSPMGANYSLSSCLLLLSTRISNIYFVGRCHLEAKIGMMPTPRYKPLSPDSDHNIYVSIMCALGSFVLLCCMCALVWKTNDWRRFVNCIFFVLHQVKACKSPTIQIELRHGGDLQLNTTTTLDPDQTIQVKVSYFFIFLGQLILMKAVMSISI